MAMFKKQCEELIKNKVTGFLYQSEKIKKILMSIHTVTIDEIFVKDSPTYSSEAENLSDFEKMVNGIVN